VKYGFTDWTLLLHYKHFSLQKYKWLTRPIFKILNRSISTSTKYINILIKCSPQLRLINSSLSLHLYLYTMFSPRRTIRLIKSSQTLYPRILRITTMIHKMLHFSPQRILSWLELQSSNLTLSQMPMLYRRHLMQWWPKWSLETSWLKEVPSSSSWWLIWHLKVYLVLLLPVAIKSLLGKCRIVGGNLELFCPCHSCIKELSIIGVVLE
jgi:hypothetical protein